MEKGSNDEARVRRIAQEAMQSSAFSFRGPGVLSGTDPGIWLLRLWYKQEKPTGVSITVGDQSTDKSIRQDLSDVLREEARRLEG